METSGKAEVFTTSQSITSDTRSQTEIIQLFSSDKTSRRKTALRDFNKLYTTTVHESTSSPHETKLQQSAASAT